MALFVRNRDGNFLKGINKEILWDIITQQCVYYKYDLNKTKTNIYGEVINGERYLLDPVILNCLIKRPPTTQPESEIGVDFIKQINFAFFKDDLINNKLVPEVGDIIMYYESYYEVDNVITNQFWGGKDPQYPYNENPLNPGLEEFGYSISIICETHLTPSDKVGIIKSRL
jgi:hypothetical protein